jgi:hypothetical protein
MMQLMAIQREQRNQHSVATQESHRSSSSLSMQAHQRSSSLQNGFAGKVNKNTLIQIFYQFYFQPFSYLQFLQYRAMKLESIRKNLIYQKKFLVGIVKELDLDLFRQAENRSAGNPTRRFRYLWNFSIIS